MTVHGWVIGGNNDHKSSGSLSVGRPLAHIALEAWKALLWQRSSNFDIADHPWLSYHYVLVLLGPGGQVFDIKLTNRFLSTPDALQQFLEGPFQMQHTEIAMQRTTIHHTNPSNPSDKTKKEEETAHPAWSDGLGWSWCDYDWEGVDFLWEAPLIWDKTPWVTTSMSLLTVPMWTFLGH